MDQGLMNTGMSPGRGFEDKNPSPVKASYSIMLDGRAGIDWNTGATSTSAGTYYTYIITTNSFL